MRRGKISRKKQRQMARALTTFVVSSILTQTVASNVALAEGMPVQESQVSKEENLAQEKEEEKNYAVNGSFETTETASSGNLKNRKNF